MYLMYGVCVYEGRGGVAHAGVAPAWCLTQLSVAWTTGTPPTSSDPILHHHPHSPHNTTIFPTTPQHSQPHHNTPNHTTTLPTTPQHSPSYHNTPHHTTTLPITPHQTIILTIPPQHSPTH
ncbi:hypothetical protein Pmani_030484 [Petrolisthes manimaculis]|uniref:Uncharacterized protein n=1 Tax=Petrolisthes manimaculis TaxID=1843537 RepID=A0AAE1TVV8_9EUCA|nr:hypothetical protein Pmani_030484 [Petrolisthes manimaculis]